MRIPSVTLIGIAIIQVAVGGGLGLGLFGLPKLGMRGVAAGQLTAFTLGAMFLAWYLVSGRSRLKLNFAAFTFQRDMFVDILKVGAISCLSPLQTVLTILIFTKILAGFGTETLAGYGMGSRLEFLLIPIAFAFGVASVPMVGMAMGAGLVARARRVAWTAGAAAGLTVGLDRPRSSRSSRRSGFRCSPAIPASPPRPIPISPGPARRSASSASAFACISPRRARRRSAGPCWPEPPGCCWSALGGWWLASSGAPAWTLVRAGRRRHGRVRPRHGAVDPPDALGQMSGSGQVSRRCTIRFVAMQACFFGELFMACKFAFSHHRCLRRSLLAATVRPCAGRRRAGRHLADTGRRRPGAGQQMRRRNLRRHRLADASRSIPPPASRKSTTRIPIRRWQKRPMIGLPLFSGMHLPAPEMVGHRSTTPMTAAPMPATSRVAGAGYAAGRRLRRRALRRRDDLRKSPCRTGAASRRCGIASRPAAIAFIAVPPRRSRRARRR